MTRHRLTPRFCATLLTVFLFVHPFVFALPVLNGPRLGSLSECQELLHKISSNEQETTPAEAFEYRRGLLLQTGGPFGQKIAHRQIKNKDGSTTLFVALQTAMDHFDPSTANAQAIFRAVTGDPQTFHAPPTTTKRHGRQIQILTAGAVSGSAARLGLTKRANDYDFETLLILQEQEGSLATLSDSHSLEIATIQRYLQNHIETVLKENPDFRFVELKAGTYLSEIDPDTEENKGIKWNLEAVRRGTVTVVDGGKTRTLTLAQALAEDSRIKVDWAVPNPNQEAPIADAYVEATALYRLGIKIGNNQTRLRGSNRVTGITEALPLRATSMMFGTFQDLDTQEAMQNVLQEMEIALESSLATTSVAKERVHQAILKSVKKYLTKDHFKVIKRVTALIQFWDYDKQNEQFGEDFGLFLKLVASKQDPELLRYTGDKQKLHEITHLQLRTILRNDHLLELSQIKAQGELLQTLREHSINLPKGVEALWLDRVQKHFMHDGLLSSELEVVLDFLDERINQHVNTLLLENSHARAYEEFVLKRLPYMAGDLAEASFLASAPDQGFQSRYRKKVQKWRKLYSAIEFFEAPELHMTWHFNGKLTETAQEHLYQVLKGFGAGETFHHGGVRVTGRNADLLAFVYQSNASQSGRVKLAKAIAAEHGARPELRFFSFMPHLTFGRFDPRDPLARQQMADFLTREAIPQFSSVKMEAMQIWQTIAEDQRLAGRPRYRQISSSSQHERKK